jgi:hypothetical protein
MLFLSAFYAVTRGYPPLLLSLAISLAAVWLLAFRVARRAAPRWWAVRVDRLARSRTSSSSGPRTRPCTSRSSPPRLMLHGKRASAARPGLRGTLLLRTDLVPVLLPLFWSGIARRRRPRTCGRSCSLAPLFLWHAFALFYTAPFPNTASAKLGTGIEVGPRAQGLTYPASRCASSPTLPTIVAGGIGVIWLRHASARPLGVLLYLSTWSRSAGTS